MADYNDDMTTNTATDPFATLTVAPNQRFAGAGQADEDLKLDRQADLVAWLWAQTWSEFAQDLGRFFEKHGYLTPRQEDSAVSMRTKCEARDAARKEPAAATSNRVTEDGVYRDANGDLFKCVHNQSGSHMYAKKLVATGNMRDVSIKDKKTKEVRVEQREDWVWSYDSGAIRTLTADMRLSLEEAQAFGRLTGTCCVCGAYLTDETSVANGIGPICGSRF